MYWIKRIIDSARKTFSRGNLHGNASYTLFFNKKVVYKKVILLWPKPTEIFILDLFYFISVSTLKQSTASSSFLSSNIYTYSMRIFCRPRSTILPKISYIFEDLLNAKEPPCISWKGNENLSKGNLNNFFTTAMLKDGEILTLWA